VNDYTVEVIDDEELVITVTPVGNYDVSVSADPPNTIVEVQQVAYPHLTNIDGGTASSIYTTIPAIDGGGAA